MSTCICFTVRGKKRAYLRAYAACGRLDKAAEKAKVHRNSHYLWLRSDPQYAEDFELAKEMAAAVRGARAPYQRVM